MNAVIVRNLEAEHAAAVATTQHQVAEQQAQLTMGLAQQAELRSQLEEALQARTDAEASALELQARNEVEVERLNKELVSFHDYSKLGVGPCHTCMMPEGCTQLRRFGCKCCYYGQSHHQGIVHIVLTCTDANVIPSSSGHSAR